MLANRARRPPGGHLSGGPSTTPATGLPTTGIPATGIPTTANRDGDGDGDDNDSPEGPRQSVMWNGRTRPWRQADQTPSNPRNSSGMASPRRSAPQPARKTFLQFLAEQTEATPPRPETTETPPRVTTETLPRVTTQNRQHLAAQRPSNSPNPDTRRPRRNAPQPARKTFFQFLMEADPPHSDTTEPRAQPSNPWDETVRVAPQNTPTPATARRATWDFENNIRSWSGDDDLSSDVEAPATPSNRRPAPRLTNIRQAAEDASVLLEIFSRTKPKDDNEIDQEHKQMIDDAFNHILQIKEKFRVMAIESKEPLALALDDMKVDAGCIVCYNYIADTVFMPCKHLALCTV